MRKLRYEGEVKGILDTGKGDWGSHESGKERGIAQVEKGKIGDKGRSERLGTRGEVVKEVEK